MEGENEVALAFRWTGPPTYAAHLGASRTASSRVCDTFGENATSYLVFDGDIAHSLGAMLKKKWRWPPKSW